MMNQNNDNDGAFVDVVTNAFGVIVLITLFIFVASGVISVQQVGKTELETETIDFTPSERFLFPPYSRYTLFYANKVLEIDFNSVARQLVNQPQKTEISMPYGTFKLFDGTLRDIAPQPYLFSDIDYYRLTFELVPAGIETAGKKLPIGAENHFIAQIKAEMGTMIPTFIVHKTGMELFARVFPYLMKSQMRFRWHVIEDEVPFTRTPKDFNRR